MPIQINLNITLSDAKSILYDGYQNDDVFRYNLDDKLSNKLREVLNEWINSSDTKLPEVSTIFTNTTTPIPYSGNENREFQVW